MGPFTISLIAGGAAGTAVDMSLFPLDTIKTRLQSAEGFRKAGGFSGIYRGIGPAFIGSAPGVAVFFGTYDTAKLVLQKWTESQPNPVVHMTAASLGEVGACLVRVPVEIVKQRRQVLANRTSTSIVAQVLKQEGLLGFYRGYFSTVLREVPFSIIQFPLWEFFKAQVIARKGSVSPFESSLCGALAGGIAGSITTPFDVAKTRIMLADSSSVEAKGKILVVWKSVYQQKGLKGLFAGAMVRTLWISVGGSIFFGTYEFVKQQLVD